MSTKKNKKPKNPDNLFQRNGIWWIRYNVNGEKIRASLKTRNLREAKQVRDRILAKRSVEARFGLANPKQPTPALSFKQIAERWMKARDANDQLAISTRRNGNCIVKRALLPTFGSTMMDDITVEQVESWLSGMRDQYARATVAQHFNILRLVIRDAIRRDWFEGPNPLDKLYRTPTHGPGRDVALSEAEARQLLDQLSGRLYYKVAVALYTGLRWGEVHGLGWADINLDSETPTLTVKRSYRGKPKNLASAATVPISQSAAALLRRWKAQQRPDSQWVFPGNHGLIVTSGNSEESRAIHEATARAGIDKHVTPHVFRHTFGTWVYERTQDPKMVQRLMRHASFQTSMRYVHDRRMLSPVVELLPELTARPGLKAV